jgi:hypothetical protein
VRSMIFGEYEYFSPAYSELCNMFDISSDDGREHFLLSLLLAQTVRLGEVAGSKGFVETAALFSFAQEAGFSQEQIGSQLERALANRLLEAPPGKSTGGPLRITSVGSYMYRSMIRRFVYVDAVIVDSPIVDLQCRKRLTVAWPISERLDRAEQFRRYLDLQWAELSGAAGLPFDWAQASQALAADIIEVRSRAEKRAAQSDAKLW